MTANDRRRLHDSFTVADRMGRIQQVCAAIHLDRSCAKWASMCGVTPFQLEQEVQQRLWDLWKDEWDPTDYPYGGEEREDSWTVPKFAARTAKNVRLELARQNRRCGMTYAPRDPVDKAQKALKDIAAKVRTQRAEVGRLRGLLASGTAVEKELDQACELLGSYEAEMRRAQEVRDTAEANGRFRVDRVEVNDLDINAVDASGTPNWRMLAAQSPDDLDESMVKTRIAQQIDPLGDPVRVWDMAAGAADMILKQVELRAGMYGRDRLLFDADQGFLDTAVRDRLRSCVWRMCVGQSEAAAGELVDLIESLQAMSPAKARRRTAAKGRSHRVNNRRISQ